MHIMQTTSIYCVDQFFLLQAKFLFWFERRILLVLMCTNLSARIAPKNTRLFLKVLKNDMEIVVINCFSMQSIECKIRLQID